jgi:ankyrin repeat protein
LEQKAYESDCDKISEILELCAKIPRKNLNVALRAAIKGTSTVRLDDTLQSIEDLIRANANVNAEESEEGRTPLMMACDKGYIEIVKRLLDQDALIDHRDQRKKTALFYAVESSA